MNVNEWLIKNNSKWTEEASKYLTSEQAKESYFMAVESMSTLNKYAANLMTKHGCHGATDITGFGIRGHAQNLCAV